MLCYGRKTSAPQLKANGRWTYRSSLRLQRLACSSDVVERHARPTATAFGCHTFLQLPALVPGNWCRNYALNGFPGFRNRNTLMAEAR